MMGTAHHRACTLIVRKFDLAPLTHTALWDALDRLAADHQLTPSGLARRAGLHPTTFNPSKRFRERGAKPRWPSMESLAKVLEALDLTLVEFAHMVNAQGAAAGDTAQRSRPAHAEEPT